MTGDTPSQSPLLHVAVAPGSQRAERGAECVFLITLENRGREAQAQSLSVTGLPRDWYRLDFDERHRAFPNERRTATLVVTVDEAAEPGAHSFQVVARADGEESRAGCTIEVLGPGGQRVAPLPSPAPDRSREAPAPGVTLMPPSVTWRGEAQGEESLRIGVRNVGSEDAEYALRVEGLPGGWYTLGQARIQVPAGRSIDTRITVHPPARARPRDYAFRVVASVEGQQVRGEATGTLTVAASERTAGSRATQTTISPLGPSTAPAEVPQPSTPVLPPDISLGPRTSFRFGPGEVAAQATLTVQNRSSLIERYQVTLEGLDEDWYNLAMTDVRLEPGASVQVPLRLTPRTSPAFPAGDYDFRIRVAPHAFPASFAEVGGVIAIAGTVSFDARLTPSQTSGRKEKFKLTLLNTGGLPFSPWLETGDPQGMCTFKYDSPQNLEVGDEAVVPIWVGARRQGFVGEAKTLDFRLRVSPAGGTSSSARFFDARFVHQPFLSRGVLLAGIFLAMVASVIGLILIIGPSSVSNAATTVRCGMDDDFREFRGGPVLIKEECMGASIACQKGFCPPAAAAETVTPAPDDRTPTPVPEQCTPDAEIGVALGQQVRLKDDARIRSGPGLDVNQIGLGNDRIGTVTDGPECADGLVWWEVDSGSIKGWTAEQTEANLRLILPR